MLTGGCYCGATRYEADGMSFHSTLCHCADCRRIAGAPMVAWFSVPTRDFRFVRGTPREFASSENVVRSFCDRCGTPLTYQHAGSPAELDITTCSLDTPESEPPEDHTHAAGRLSWIHLSDGLRSYPNSRTSRVGRDS